MSSKTKIVVLHLKEVIYTGIFVALGILFIILLVIMFLPSDKEQSSMAPAAESDSVATSYIPGIYTTSLVLGDHAIDVEVVVDRDYISTIRMHNLDEAVTTMYPLIEPAFDSLTAQIYETQSLENINYSDENKYTTMVLMEAIQSALNKAVVTFEPEE